MKVIEYDLPNKDEALLNFITEKLAKASAILLITAVENVKGEIIMCKITLDTEKIERECSTEAYCFRLGILISQLEAEFEVQKKELEEEKIKVMGLLDDLLEMLSKDPEGTPNEEPLPDETKMDTGKHCKSKGKSMSKRQGKKPYESAMGKETPLKKKSNKKEEDLKKVVKNFKKK